MHFAAIKREGNVLYGRNTAILLCRLADFHDGDHALTLSFELSFARGSDTTMPSPRAAMNTWSRYSTAAVTPCVRPSARLCRLERGWNALSSFTHRPADIVGAHGLSKPRCFTPPPCNDS